MKQLSPFTHASNKENNSRNVTAKSGKKSKADTLLINFHVSDLFSSALQLLHRVKPTRLKWNNDLSKNWNRPWNWKRWLVKSLRSQKIQGTSQQIESTLAAVVAKKTNRQLFFFVSNGKSKE